MFNFFPYTNFHELNADWILKKITEVGEGFVNFTKEIKTKFDTFTTDINNSFSDFTSNMNKKFTDFTNENTKKVDELSVKIDNEIEKIPDMVETNSKETLNQWKTDGTFNGLIEQTYGALNFLDDMSNKKILILGDELSTYGETYKDRWTWSFKSILENANITLQSYATDGATLSSQATKFKTSTFVPDILIVWCGIHDVINQTAMSSIRDSLNAIQTKINALNPYCQVYLFSTYKNAVLNVLIPQTAYWRAFKNFATKNGWTFVDAFSSAPIITTEVDTIKNKFYKTKTDKYFDYSSAYAPILARWILQVLISKTPTPYGTYRETINAPLLNPALNFTAAFTQSTLNYVIFGTDIIKVRLIGNFSGTATGFTPICTLPDFLKPANIGIRNLTAYETGENGDDMFIAHVLSDGKIEIASKPINSTQPARNTNISLEFIFDLLSGD